MFSSEMFLAVCQRSGVCKLLIMVSSYRERAYESFELQYLHHDSR